MSTFLKRKTNVLFAIYPNSDGFGYVYMSNPRGLLDYGLVSISPICNRKLIRRISKSFNQVRPNLLVIQNPDALHARTGRRVKRLIRRIKALAEKMNIKVVQYSRDQIREVFEQFGVITKYEISRLLLTEFKELEHRAPKKRSLWTREDRNMAIFDALSLALTWYYAND